MSPFGFTVVSDVENTVLLQFSASIVQTKCMLAGTHHSVIVSSPNLRCLEGDEARLEAHAHGWELKGECDCHSDDSGESEGYRNHLEWRWGAYGCGVCASDVVRARRAWIAQPCLFLHLSSATTEPATRRLGECGRWEKICHLRGS